VTFDRLAQLMRDCVITDELHTRGQIVGIEIDPDDYKANYVNVKIRTCYAKGDRLSNYYKTVSVLLDAPNH